MEPSDHIDTNMENYSSTEAMQIRRVDSKVVYEEDKEVGLILILINHRM